MTKNQVNTQHIVTQNRRARYDYSIEETFNAGLSLTGSEVKSLRAGRASLVDAYADDRSGDFYLCNSNIPEYGPAGRFNHEPKRPRKFLLKRKEMNFLIGAINQKGKTVVALSIYFNERGLAKVQLGLATGKRQVDKREAIQKRDWQRQKNRLLRSRG